MAKKHGFKYPRLTLLVIILVITFIFFSKNEFFIGELFKRSGIVGAFISGFFYSFSFTAFTAMAALFELGGVSEDLIQLGLIAGIGTTIGDLVIYKTARISFSNEFKLLYKEPILKVITKPIPMRLQHVLKLIVGVLIIASPLPDEAGVALLANGYVFPKKVFVTIAYILNTLGIFSILFIGKQFS